MGSDTDKQLTRTRGVVVVLICCVTLLATALCKLNHDYKQYVIVNETYSDSVRVYKDKYNRSVFEANGYLYSLNDISKVNDKLYEEIKQLKHVISYNSMTTHIQYDTIIIDNSVVTKIDSLYKADWSYKDYKDSINFINIRGNSKFVIDKNLNINNFKTYIDYLNIGLDINIAQQLEGNTIIAKAYSNNPHFVVNKYSSFILKEKELEKLVPKKTEHIIFSVGVGYGLGVYDFKLQPYIGINVGYKIFGF